MKLLRHIVAIACLLASTIAHAAEALPVAGPGSPASHEFRLRYPKKEHLTAVQLYDLGYPAKAIDQIIGQFVLLDVVVEIARDVPLVKIVIPENLAAGPNPPRRAIPAHLVNATSHFSECKKGERFRIEGLIVNEGYGAYMIYLQKVQRIK